MRILEQAIFELNNPAGIDAGKRDITLTINGWEVIERHHALVRTGERHADTVIDELLDRVVNRLNAIVNRITRPGEYLFFSVGLNRGIVCDVTPQTKRIRVITVLDAGKQVALAGTKKVIIEGVQYDLIHLD